MAADWFSGAIIWKIEGGVLYFLVLSSRFTDNKHSWEREQVKFPGGKNRDHPEDSDPRETLRRELLEETGLYIPRGIEPEVIHSPDPKDGHQKYFFLVPFDSLVGELRKVSIHDGNTLLSPPRWVSAFGIKVYRTHKRAAREAVRIIMNPHLNLAR